MTQILLSNAMPTGEGARFEAIVPADNPRWRYLAIASDGANLQGDGLDALVLKAIPTGPRVGGHSDKTLAIWVVLTNAVDGKEAEFDDWYDNQHIHDSVAVPGFVSGQRYRVSAPPGAAASPWSHLTLYEIELDGLAETFAELAARRGTDRMPNPGYLAPGAATVAFRPLP